MQNSRNHMSQNLSLWFHIFFVCLFFHAVKPQVTPTHRSCPVLVVGGSLGGVAAALESASTGVETCFIVESGYIGGQMTSQGVSALDEAFFDTSPLYESIITRIREHYLKKYGSTIKVRSNSGDGGFNPGECWVSRLCYEPKVAVSIIDDMLSKVKKLTVLRGFIPISVGMTGDRISQVSFARDHNPLENKPPEALVITSSMVVDTTELGDLISLSGTQFRLGSDSRSDTGEPNALENGNINCVQPITMGFILERRPDSENHVIPKPPNYNPKLYSLGKNKFFTTTTSFWAYRRIKSAKALGKGTDIALINWHYGNDFKEDCGPLGCNIIGRSRSDKQQILQRAREQGLGFVYWLQKDAPRDDSTTKTGYPNLKLKTDVMGDNSAFSSAPYIREARRVVGMTTIREFDLASSVPTDKKRYLHRSIRSYTDSVGLARYFFADIHDMPHPCRAPASTMAPGSGQIPLRALIPAKTDGLLIATGKTISTTHLTNGVYRMHSTEWNIGQAAGAVAALTRQVGFQPRQIVSTERLLRLLQLRLLMRPFSPLFWWGDKHNKQLPAARQVMKNHADPKLYVATQMLGVMGIIPAGPALAFDPWNNVGIDDAKRWIANALSTAPMELHQMTSTLPASGAPISKGNFLAQLAIGFCRTSPDKCPASLGPKFASATLATIMASTAGSESSVIADTKPAIHTKTEPMAKSSGSNIKPSFNDICGKGALFDISDLAVRRGWITKTDLIQPSKPKRLCNGSLGAYFSPSVVMRRAEAAKILWNFVFREILRSFAPSKPTIATTAAATSAFVDLST